MSVVLVTGATGVVGSALVPMLLEDPDARPVLLVRALSQAHLGQRLEELRAFWRPAVDDPAVLSRITAVRGDVTAPGLGLDRARRFTDAARASHTVVAIGGINASNAADVIATGVDGICVVSAIAAAPDPEAAARELLEKWSTP